jgi:hypothetical protein
MLNVSVRPWIKSGDAILRRCRAHCCCSGIFGNAEILLIEVTTGDVSRDS